MENRDASGCRKRFVNYLEQVLYKGEWTAEEDAALLRAYAIHGNHWSQIAKEGILNRRSARALGWRWAKVFARKVSVVNDNQARRHHPYKRQSPPPAAAAAAAAAAAVAVSPSSARAQSIPSGPSPMEECAEAISSPHAALAASAAASAAVAASSPVISASAQSELISLLVRLETQKIVRALSLLLAQSMAPRQEPEQPQLPAAPEVWQQAPPSPAVFLPTAMAHPTFDPDSISIEPRYPVDCDDSCTIPLLGQDFFSLI
jgi:hypothetical protein